MKWTLCKEAMPPEKQRVLCVTKRHGLKILHLSPAGEYKRQIDWQGEAVSSVIQRVRLEEVTHWMLLPEMPEGWGQIATTPNVKVTGA